MNYRRLFLIALLYCAFFGWNAASAQDFIPRRQDKPPGPPLTPAQAIEKMTVPEGFTVELVASEPDIVNPVAMAIDERGRFWITESFEYPRREPGPGRDRVKVLEDTTGDGRADKITVFAEGLNIPSGIAVGHGGVWVANSPDLLFLQDTDGDGKADKQEVVVTGFGRTDTHELPNSLTWGPDGWLYGLNGVFNYSHVKYPKSSPHYRADHPGWQFTCALFRIHPQTREFQVFCEGTSNPWGVAINDNGSFFLSACVIDHLWHQAETGYYLRQGGPYPPFTWPLPSIVKHKHQAAAYCGIHYYDSDAYPDQYRQKLYMGNIHGGCINSDKLQRNGSTYFATGEPDFLTANDVWFMPVVQKTGPDGSLYILDWYDRYHCYQDANADPQGVDRGHGRLYRVRYKDTPRAKPFDLHDENDDQLLARLAGGNDYLREVARRLLAERNHPQTRGQLWDLVNSDSAPRTTRLNALWTLISTFELETDQHLQLLAHADPTFRAWGVRAAGDIDAGSLKKLDQRVRDKVAALVNDSSRDVQLQVAIAARKIQGLDPVLTLMTALANCGDDPLIPHIVWQNLHPLLESEGELFVTLATKMDAAKSPGIREVLPRAIDRILAAEKPNPVAIATLFAVLAQGERPNPAVAGKCLATLAERVQSHELAGEQLAALQDKLQAPLAKVLQGKPDNPLYIDAALLAVSWKDASAAAAVRKLALDPEQPLPRRQQAIDALVTSGDSQLLALAKDMFADRRAATLKIRGGLISALGRLDDERVGKLLLTRYDNLEPELKPRAIEVLTARTSWSHQLLAAIEQKQLPPDALNTNQVRKLLASGDQEIAALVAKTWGTVRTERDPAREQVIADMRQMIRNTPGDPHRGAELYKKLCGQCHKIYGEGQEVGPEITANGRGNFEQLLSNVFDPSLVIGAAYQARTVTTTDGRVLTGILVEDNAQRIVLKQQGDKLETIARGDVEEVAVSPLSLMPEGIEKQYQPQEIADLFAFLTLDRPPSDPQAQPIPGTKEEKPR
jgi:putative heme-binding domain-containing protein